MAIRRYVVPTSNVHDAFVVLFVSFFVVVFFFYICIVQRK